jgi:hypothetical protein
MNANNSTVRAEYPCIWVMKPTRAPDCSTKERERGRHSVVLPAHISIARDPVKRCIPVGTHEAKSFLLYLIRRKVGAGKRRFGNIPNLHLYFIEYVGGNEKRQRLM